MSGRNEIRIPAAVLGAAVAAMLAALGIYLAMRRRADERWLEALIRRSGSDERRSGRQQPATSSGMRGMPVDHQAMEHVPGVRITVIR